MLSPREKRSATDHPNSRARFECREAALRACCKLLLDVNSLQELTEKQRAELKAPLALYLEVTR